MRTFSDFRPFNNYVGLVEPLDDQIDVGKYGKTTLLDSEPIRIDFYRISFKTNYINTNSPEYDPTNPKPITAVFFNSPGNLYEWHLEDDFEGYYLQLSKQIINDNRFLFQNYLEYGEHEALYLTPEEQSEVISLFELLISKYDKSQNKNDVLLAYINLQLSLIESFYKRQFDTDINSYNHVVTEFQQLLRDYYKETFKGLPSVQYFAEQMNLSPNYLGDIIKSRTHKSAIDFIHDHIIMEAKKLLIKSTLNNTEIAYSLGFTYPNYFAKFFKKQTKLTPKQFRAKSIEKGVL